MSGSIETVAVCDTEPIAVEGLRRLLESGAGPHLIAAENSLADGMDAVRELSPGLLVVDKAFGIEAVIDWLARLREQPEPITAIVWGVSISYAEAVRLLHFGARGVIRKTASLDALLACIAKVSAGGTWMEDDMLLAPERPAQPGHSSLTTREVQVMDLVERGLKNKDIGIALGISTGTVKIHLKHIFEKTGIRGRYGLALSGLRDKGLLTPAPAGRMDAAFTGFRTT
jgi:two-component system, NarL family, nitrate/nitrite response regulator NarL